MGILKTIHASTNYVIIALVSVVVYFGKDLHERFEANEKQTGQNTNDIIALQHDVRAHEQEDEKILNLTNGNRSKSQTNGGKVLPW